jgi:hypothetical protein
VVVMHPDDVVHLQQRISNHGQTYG